MQVPGADEAMTHVMTWASRPKWLERFNGVATEHLAKVCARFALTPAGLGAALGDLRHASLMGCVFKDFVSLAAGATGVYRYLADGGPERDPPAPARSRELRRGGYAPGGLDGIAGTVGASSSHLGMRHLRVTRSTFTGRGRSPNKVANCANLSQVEYPSAVFWDFGA